jgi:membrane protease subunit HflK
MPDNYPGGRPEDPIEELRAMWDQLRRRYEGGDGRFQLPNPLWILGGVLFAWALTGIFIVAPDERAVILRFGEIVREQGPGPGYRLPWPIEEVYKPTVTQVRKEEFGTRNVVGANRAPQTEALMLTGDQNIVALQFIVQYRVKTDPDGARDFLFNVRDQRGTVRSAAEAAMREVIGGTKIDDALTQGKDEIQIEAQRTLQAILDTYDAGVEIVTVKLMNVDPPDEVEKAFKDVISAQQDGERMINKANGYANTVIPQARGEAAKMLKDAEAYKEAKVAEATGAAQRFVNLYDEYAKAKDVTRQRLYLETLEEVLPRMNKFLIDDSAAGGVVPYLPLDRMPAAVPTPPAPAAAAAGEVP